MADTRPAKRVHLACDNCRKKKTRCPGERPTCSTCQMHQQACIYVGTNDDTRRGDDRDDQFGRQLQTIESKLDATLQRLNSLATPAPPKVTSPIDSVRKRSIARTHLHDEADIASGLQSDTSQLRTVADTFSFHFAYQPLPLFRPNALLNNITTGRKEILHSVLALCHVHLRQSDFPVSLPSADACAESVRRLISDTLFDGDVDLSSLQASALSALYDLNSGRPRRAKLTIGTASRLALSLFQNREESSQDHRDDMNRCFWSLYLLETMSGLHPGVLACTKFEEAPPFPRSASRMSSGRLVSPPTSRHNPSDSSRHADVGIVGYLIQLNRIWPKLAKYLSRAMDPNLAGDVQQTSPPPPWSQDSDYAYLSASILKFESTFVAAHRFEQAKFSDVSPDDLHSNRAYWTPFLHIQFQYHAIRCLLDHPFLCSSWLRNGRSSTSASASASFIPASFLQASSDASMLHSNWIVRFIDMAQSKGYKVFDPFIAYCATVSATIHLHHSYVADEQLRRNAQLGARKCIAFVEAMAPFSPVVQDMAHNLRLLHSNAHEWSRIHRGSPSVAKGPGPAGYGMILLKCLSFHSDKFTPLADEKLFSSSTVSIHGASNIGATFTIGNGDGVVPSPSTEATRDESSGAGTRLPPSSYQSSAPLYSADSLGIGSPVTFSTLDQSMMLGTDNVGEAITGFDGSVEMGSMIDGQFFDFPQLGKGLQDWWNLGNL